MSLIENIYTVQWIEEWERATYTRMISNWYDTIKAISTVARLLPYKSNFLAWRDDLVWQPYQTQFC